MAETAHAAGALARAVAAGDADAVASLLGAGADPNAKVPESGLTPLLIAAGLGHTAIARLLLASGADVNCSDDRAGAFPIHKACQGGHLAMVELLTEHGASLNCQAALTGHTPLIEAAWYSAVDVVEYLLDQGARLEVPTHYGFTLADHLAYSLKVNTSQDALTALQAIADAVERRRADDQARVEANRLIRAVLANDLAEIAAQLEAGADVEQRAPILGGFDDGYTPLLLAARDGHLDAARLLLAAGADVNAVDPIFGAVPLHKATYHGDAAMTELLAAHPGVDLDRQGPTNGYTPLHDAIWHGYVECATVLVLAGARVDVRGHDGCTPLALAIRQLGEGHEFVAYLRGRGAGQ